MKILYHKNLVLCVCTSLGCIRTVMKNNVQVVKGLFFLVFFFGGGGGGGGSLSAVLPIFNIRQIFPLCSNAYCVFSPS